MPKKTEKRLYMLQEKIPSQLKLYLKLFILRFSNFISKIVGNESCHVNNIIFQNDFMGNIVLLFEIQSYQF